VRQDFQQGEFVTKQSSMTDMEQIRARLKGVREMLDAIDPRSTEDPVARRRIEFGRERCEDLIRELEALLDGKGR
jgi:hypothetical protein